jgi:thioredoxin-related protein
MKTLLCRFVAPIAVLLLSTGLVSAKPGWMDDYKKGLSQASTEKKLILLDFTGSDWCPWCIKLDKEVFSQKEFKDYAKDNLVLVELDFPRGKKLPKHVEDQNDSLQQEYKIEGYPTVIVLNAQGKKVGQLGYMEGGPKAFIAELDKLKGK